MVQYQHEDTFQAVSDAVFSKEQPVYFRKGSVALWMLDRIVMRDAIAGVLFHVDNAMTKLLLEVVTAQHKGVHNRQSAAL